MEHVEESVAFKDDDAVALGVSLGLDEPKTIDDLFGTWEVLERVVISSTNHIAAYWQFHCIGILGRNVDLGIREERDGIGVVGMLVGDEDAGHLFRLIAQSLEGCHKVGNGFAHIERSAQLLGWSGEAGLEACIDEYHFVTRVDEEVL